MLPQTFPCNHHGDRGLGDKVVGEGAEDDAVYLSANVVSPTFQDWFQTTWKKKIRMETYPLS